MNAALAIGVTLALGVVVVQVASCAGGGGDVETGVGGSSLSLGAGAAGGNDGCASWEETATLKPVNLYIMFDKSSSMAGAKWAAAEAGLGAFLDDASSAGLRVALRFFPREPDVVPECDQNAYKTPAVGFGVLPSHAQALKDGMAAESPDGFGTPIYPALGGAILEGIDQALADPEARSAVLLVTDGAPEGPMGLCGGVDPEDPAVIADLAATGLSYGVITCVVGLSSAAKPPGDLIADAGGSDEAIIVADAGDADQIRDALAKVRGQTITCEYELPQQVLDGDVAVGFVNVEVTPSDGSDPYTLPFDPSCSGAGWRYDDEDNPTAIVICPETCEALRADIDAQVRVVLGCNTLVE